MRVQPRQRARQLSAVLVALGLLLVLTLVLASQTATPTSGTGGEAEMRLLVTDPPGACVDDQCQLPTGATFKLGVEIVGIPPAVAPDCVGRVCAQDAAAGYILAQSSIFYGGDITYDPSLPAADEIRWPDCVPAAALKSQIDRRLPVVPGQPNTDELVSHGCVTGLFNPPLSVYTGLFLEITVACSPEDTINPIDLLPYTETRFATPDTIAGSNGTLFRRATGVLVDGQIQEDVHPKVNSLTVICGEPPTPTPGPSNTPGGPTETATPTPDLSTATPTATATPLPVTPTATFVSLIPCGDINGDRLVNAEDALWLLWLSSNTIPFLPSLPGRLNPGDVNGDGAVDPLDALFVLWIELNLFRCL